MDVSGSAEDHAATALRRIDLGSEARQDVLPLRARPSGRIPYAYGGRIQAWREVGGPGNELRKSDARVQWKGPAV